MGISPIWESGKYHAKPRVRRFKTKWKRESGRKDLHFSKTTMSFVASLVEGSVVGAMCCIGMEIARERGCQPSMGQCGLCPGRVQCYSPARHTKDEQYTYSSISGGVVLVVEIVVVVLVVLVLLVVVVAAAAAAVVVVVAVLYW